MILVLTQSSNTGQNYLLAQDCQTLIKHFSEIEADIKNFDDDIDLDLYDKILMIVPEWNRSIPYTLKSLIDNSGWPSKFKGKEVWMIGTSGGIGGNMIGISHLTDILDYIGAKVKRPKVYIEHIKDFDREGAQGMATQDMIIDVIKQICSTYQIA
jgi:NAD(P)H-dependent FMN reductase